MTSKDYIAIAAMLKDQREIAVNQLEATFANNLDSAKKAGSFEAGVEAGVVYVTGAIADLLQRDNPRFDRKRFMRAVQATGAGPAPIINQHPLYEETKSICPKCHGRSTTHTETLGIERRADEASVQLKCTDCGHVFYLADAAKTEIARREKLKEMGEVVAKEYRRRYSRKRGS